MFPRMSAARVRNPLSVSGLHRQRELGADIEIVSTRAIENSSTCFVRQFTASYA